jgi:hypothetical protein
MYIIDILRYSLYSAVVLESKLLWLWRQYANTATWRYYDVTNNISFLRYHAT